MKDLSDITCGDVPIESLWVAFGRRAAAGVGALTALTSLLWHAPLWVASVRGAVAWLAIVLSTQACAWLLARTLPAPEAEAAAEGAGGEGGEPEGGTGEPMEAEQ